MPDTSHDADRPIGRRAFIGLVVVGIAALLVGKDILPGLRSTTSSSGSRGTFRINTVAPAPAFDAKTWKLTVDGLFRKPLTLNWAQFRALPEVERTRDFYCVEGWGVKSVAWRGITVRQLMETADIDPQATHLVFHSSDLVYTDSLTIQEAMGADMLLAYEADGQPLPPDDGQPLRLVVPGRYGYKYVKWVVRVEAIKAKDASPEGYQGYWESRGYPADAVIP